MIDRWNFFDSLYFFSQNLQTLSPLVFILLHRFMSITVQILLVFHAPISKNVMYFFNAQWLNGHGFLKTDYSILIYQEMSDDARLYSDRWLAFLPFVLIVLIVFTIGLPFFLTYNLVRHRKELHTPRFLSMYGFLYIRYHKGVEFWEVSEIMRKTFLCGIICYIPVLFRSAVGVLVCVVAVASKPQLTLCVEFFTAEVGFVRCKIVRI